MRRLLLAAATLPAAQAAYGAAFRFMLRRNVKRLMAGDVDALVNLYADDATLVFPGDNSWGPEYRGRDEIRAFLERFLSVGLRGEVRQIVVSGPPWDTTAYVHFPDRATAPDGTVVYENDAVIRLKVRWGKVVFECVYEDTEKVAEFDRYLEARTPVASG